MTVKEAVLEKLQTLPAVKQQEVLDFVEFLKERQAARKPRRSVKGSLAHLKFEWNEEILRQARNEMWRGYTKDTWDEK
ncbi:MAG: DUF2281 domain-containing protein [Acidobacteria bacterium]|nr:DUF2281 domain-containing protein [Acidobacteriota bacterium]